MDLLQEKLCYKFRDPELLQTALTHTTLTTPTSSPFNSKKRTCDHLKILGDCVIKLLTSQYAICISLPNEKVHKIVKIKDNLSCRNCQNVIGRSLQLEGVVVTNLQQDQICSHLDIFVKSLFGAIFLDAGGSEKKGLNTCWKVFLKLWKPAISAYGSANPLISRFPEPIYSSRDFLKERFSNFKVEDLAILEGKIGHNFLKSPHLLEQAMTHDSIDVFRNTEDNRDPTRPEFVHFQNLEFLGDSVLELVIMEYLYLRSSSADPLGKMLFFNRDTGQKLYSSRFQIQVAKNLQLEKFVIKSPQTSLATYDDFVESLIGSIYVHGRFLGLKYCVKAVLEIWGLEEDVGNEKTTKQELSQQNCMVDNKENIAANTDNVQKVVAPPPLLSLKAPATPKSKPPRSKEDKLQEIVGYKFTNNKLRDYLPAHIDVNDADARATSMNIINSCKNLQTLGKRLIELVVTEYVIGLCHASDQADLSAELKRSFEKLLSALAGNQVLLEIAKKFQLPQYWNFQQDDQKTPTTIASPSEIIYLIFGAVYADSSGDLPTVQRLFFRMWSTYLNGSKQSTPLTLCFPDTSEEQQKFREGVYAQISKTMWNKMWVLFGHTFTRKNLLEQALTDEKSQGYAKQHLNAYPIGNPFGLQILGKAVLDVFIAYRCYLNTVEEPESFPGVVLRMDQSLYNVLKSRFPNLVRYYAHHNRYPYPPKKNPRAPFEAMFGALYVDVGGGTLGLRQSELSIEKACPTLLTMKKAKGVNKQSCPETESSLMGESNVSRPVSQNREDGNSDEGSGGESLSVASSSASSPKKKSSTRLEVQEKLNKSFGTQESISTSGANTTLPMFAMSAPIMQDPLLSELQTTLAYKFVNPTLLRIVLEVNFSIGQDGKQSSRNYFDIFKMIGTRAFNLLATEFALESLSIPNNSDISAKDKKRVETHRAHLASPPVMNLVAKLLDLKKYVFTSAEKTAPSNDEFITALLGAVFIDSRANYLKISALFNKFWKPNLNRNPGPPILAQCFPSTTEGQKKLRTATSTLLNDSSWRKFYTKLGHNFRDKNLLEQALTDESSQEAAKLKHNAYPTGNPFALRLLGKCAIQLVIAYKTLPCSVDAQVTNFIAGLEHMEKALFNSFKNNFLGVEKYYACIKTQKSQKFPPNGDPFGPYEAVIGAVYVDSGTGNKGLDTIAIVITKRDIGMKVNKKLNFELIDSVPTTILPVVNLEGGFEESSNQEMSSSSIPVKNCSTPEPGMNSTFPSETLNTSFNSKCAANFGISPVQVNKSPPKPIVQQENSIPEEEPCCSKSIKPSASATKKNSSPVISSQGSPKKQQKEQKKSYASALVNGKPAVQLKTDNSLIIAVTNAQCQIEALRKKQEFVDKQRKRSLEMQLLQPNCGDDLSIASSCRSRCHSTSTITSIGSQQQQLGDVSGQKRKRGRKGGKKQNKKAKAATLPKQDVPPPQQQMSSPRVSAWCQNQIERMHPFPSEPSCAVADDVPSSCTIEVHQQRSTVHQLQATRQEVDEVDECQIKNCSSPSRSASVSGTTTHHSTHVPVNMVSGYRKTVVRDDDHGWMDGNRNKDGSCKTKNNIQSQNGSCANAATVTNENGEPIETEPPSGFSYLGVLKWTSLILGVAFLLRRYNSQGK